MSTESQSEAISLESDTEAQVIEYLHGHLNFFEAHPDLLNILDLSHSPDGAVSLIERQVTSLRQQIDSYQSQLKELVAVAQENEALNNRLHRLTLTLIGCIDFDEVINALQDILHDDFRAEAVELHLFNHADADSDSDLDGFRVFIEAGHIGVCFKKIKVPV